MTNYWVTTNPRRKALHANRNCATLDNARGLRKATDIEIDRLPKCSHCAGTFERYSEGAKDHYTALKEAAANGD